MSVRTWDDIYTAALNAILATLRADRASILLLDAHGVMHFEAWRGLSPEHRQTVDGHSPVVASRWALWDADGQPFA